MPQFYHRLFLRCLLLFYDYYYIAQIVRKQALISPKICEIRTDFFNDVRRNLLRKKWHECRRYAKREAALLIILEIFCIKTVCY